MPKKDRPNKPVNNQHDAVFKVFFSDENTAKDYLRGYIPESVSNPIDISRLHKSDSSFVSGRFGASFSDIVYETCLSGGQPVKILFLFEHKSYQPTAPVHLQLLDYLLQIWENDLKNNRALSFVAPVVVYHGKSGWLQKPLSDYFPGMPPGWQPFLPNFSYLLTDLSHVSDQEISSKNEEGHLKNLFMALKYAYDKDWVFENWEKILTFGGQWEEGEPKAILLQSLTLYIINLYDMTEAQFKTLNQKLPKQEQNILDLIPEVLTKRWKDMVYDEAMKAGLNSGIQEGLEQGRKQGLTQGIQEGLQQGLTQGLTQGKELSAQAFALKLIKEFPEMTDKKIAELSGADEVFVQKARSSK